MIYNEGLNILWCRIVNRESKCKENVVNPSIIDWGTQTDRLTISNEGPTNSYTLGKTSLLIII